MSKGTKTFWGQTQRHRVDFYGTNKPMREINAGDADDFEAHEARVCIHDSRTLDDPRRPKLYSEQQYLRTPEGMQALFSDIPEALENSVEIAKRCNIELTLGKNFLPDFPIPDGMTIDEYKRRNLMGVEITSADVGGIVATLLSRTFSTVTGAHVPIDGGNERVI